MEDIIDELKEKIIKLNHDISLYREKGKHARAKIDEQ
jgi:hypothetical protein